MKNNFKSNKTFVNLRSKISKSLILQNHIILYRCLNRNDQCKESMNYTHLCACFFMKQCGLTGPMQKALFVYLNILHRLDKSSFFQYLHTQAQNDMFWPYAYCLLVSSLKQAKVNEMKQNKRKKLYLFISNKKTTCLRKTVTYISHELLMMSNSVLSSALTPTVQYMTEWTVFG